MSCQFYAESSTTKHYNLIWCCVDAVISVCFKQMWHLASLAKQCDVVPAELHDRSSLDTHTHTHTHCTVTHFLSIPLNIQIFFGWHPSLTKRIMGWSPHHRRDGARISSLASSRVLVYIHPAFPHVLPVTLYCDQPGRTASARPSQRGVSARHLVAFTWAACSKAGTAEDDGTRYIGHIMSGKAECCP